MIIFKRTKTLRRFLSPVYDQGYTSIPYTDLRLQMDVQTTGNSIVATEDGADATQMLKVFCDSEILAENQHTSQKADRLWFQGKWFECATTRLSENTPLRHWVATFVECANQDDPPEEEQ